MVPASRGQRIGVISAIVVAAGVRITRLAVKWHQPLMLNDSYWYSGTAVQIARGKGFSDAYIGGPTAEHGPLTPIVLAAVSWIHHPIPWQRALMTVIGIGTVVGIVLLARRLGGWSAAVAAGWIAALYPNFWMNDSLVMSETLAIAMVLVVVWLALDVVERPQRMWRAVACGAAIGLAGLARSELVVLLPLLAVVVAVSRSTSGGRARRAAGDVACMAVGTIVVLAPWVGPNLVRFDHRVLLTTNDGTTLLGANCPDSYHGGGIGGWSLLCLAVAEGPPGEDPSVRAGRERRLAARYATDHLGRLPVVVAARLGRMVDVVGLSNMVNGDAGEERPRWATWTGIVAFWVLASLAAAGFVLLAPPARWVLLAPVVGVVLITVAFYGSHRIRAPAEPSIVVAAAVTIGRVVDGRLRREPT